MEKVSFVLNTFKQVDVKAMISVIFLAISVITLAYIWIKRRYNYWRDRGFVQATATFPFGSFKGVGTKVTSFQALDVVYKEFKGKAPVVGIYSFLTPSIMPLDPEFLRDVFVREFSSFHDRGMYYNKVEDPMSANLLTLEGQEWRDRRLKLTSIFTSGKIKMMFETVNSISDKLVSVVEKSLSKSNEQEMRNWAQRFTGDNIGNIAFGLECSCLDDEKSEFMRYGRRMFDLTTLELMTFFFTVDFPNVSRKLGLRFFPKECGEFFHNTFLQTFEYRLKNNIQRNDFVSMLLNLKDSFTPTELAAESTLVFGAGYETSSTLMTFTLYELALNPDIQHRLREEITTGIKENDGKLTYDLLCGFKYLDMVTSESLRKFPPIADNLRKCTQDYKIPGTDLVITKGTNIEMNIISFHHDAEYFPDPEKFDPERFNDENVKNIRPFTYLPFGEGARICLGMRFGLMQSKMGIAKLITNFLFSPCDKTTIPMKFVPSAPFLRPEGGMWLKVEKI